MQPQSADRSRQEETQTPELPEKLSERLNHMSFTPGEGCCECTEGAGIHGDFFESY
jgi:hypothetical protein